MNLTNNLKFIFFFWIFNIKSVFSLWCYQCVSTHPGCGMFDFDWRYYWSYYCPAPDDKCVKIIEQRGADLMVVRDCLSNLEAHRRDIPADHYEGCRPAATDPLLAHYVNTSIQEIDIRRKYYHETLYCFCDFDERCNGSFSVKSNILLLAAIVAIVLLSYRPR